MIRDHKSDKDDKLYRDDKPHIDDKLHKDDKVHNDDKSHRDDEQQLDDASPKVILDILKCKNDKAFGTHSHCHFTSMSPNPLCPSFLRYLIS